MADEVAVALGAGVALDDGAMAGAVDVGEDGVTVGVGVGVEVRVALGEGEMAGAVDGGEDSVVGHAGMGLARLVADTSGVEDWVPGTFELGPVGSIGNGAADEHAGCVSEG